MYGIGSVNKNEAQKKRLTPERISLEICGPTWT